MRPGALFGAADYFEVSCNDGQTRLIIVRLCVLTVDYLRTIQDGDCTFLNIGAIRRN